MTSDINLLAVLVSTIMSMVIGFIWYMPNVFGNRWMHMAGVHHDEARKGAARAMAGQFAAALITNYILATFMAATGALSAGDGVAVGFLAWFGFIATAMIGIVLFERKPLKYYAIVAGYHLVNLIVAGIILGAWQS